jgi:hypothetical protein
MLAVLIRHFPSKTLPHRPITQIAVIAAWRDFDDGVAFGRARLEIGRSWPHIMEEKPFIIRETS